VPDTRDFVGGIVDLLKGRAPLPPQPHPPGLPKRPATETPGMRQYELTRAQDDARNNPAFQPKRDGTTFCNRAVCETVKRMKGPMGVSPIQAGSMPWPTTPPGTWRKMRCYHLAPGAQSIHPQKRSSWQTKVS